MKKRFLEKIKELHKITQEKNKDERLFSKRRFAILAAEIFHTHITSFAPGDICKQVGKWREEIESYNLKELEEIITTLANGTRDFSYLGQSIHAYENPLRYVFSRRKHLLNSSFKYTAQNTKKLLWVIYNTLKDK